MPRKKKEPIDMTTEELAKSVFPPKVLKELKRIAREGEETHPPNPKKGK